MDPKQTGGNMQMDPKLKEVYDRVMGAPTGGTPTPPANPGNPSQPTEPSAPGMPDLTTPTTSINPMPNAMPSPTPDLPATPMPNASMKPSDPTTEPTPNADAQSASPVLNIPGLDMVGNPSTQTPQSADATPAPTLDATKPVLPGMPDLTSLTSDNPNTEPGAANIPLPPADTQPAMPTSPFPPEGADNGGNVNQVMPNQPDIPATPGMDALKATMNMPTIAPQETVQIGLGGSPVAATTKAKGKGISPVILILGAVVFLIIYAIFWVRFFGLKLPFLP